MKYSNKILTDDNFDEEIEKLSDIIGFHHDNFDDFVKTIEGFEKQQHNNGFDEFIKSKIIPNKASDFKQASQKGKAAYEFGNGFILFNFEVVL